MNKEIIITDELIARYLCGEATPEEAIAVQEWQVAPANRLYFQQLQDSWHDAYPSQTPGKVDPTMAWARMSVNLKSEMAAHKSKGSTFDLRQSWMSVAASVALVLGIGLALYFYNADSAKNIVTVSGLDSVSQVVLPDNSHVTLNLNTTISYPENFEDSQRTVQFHSGEAFFKVTSNKTKPFVIESPLANIKVVGTAFNVVVSNDLMEVSVDEGRVLVYNRLDSVYLDPGSTVQIRTGMSDIKPQTTSDRNSWAYATHKFVFENTPLNEVFRNIEKTQHCDIKLKDPAIGNCKLTATFESVSTDYILTLITEAMNLSVTKNDKTFTVAGEGCH